MQSFLRKLRLVDDFIVELDVTQSKFVSTLDAIVDESELNFLLDSFDPLVRTKNKYKGIVNYTGFKIKRRRRFFDFLPKSSIASGKLTVKNNKLLVNTTVNGVVFSVTTFFIILIVLYLMVIVGIFYSTESLIFIPFILLHSAFMFGVPYLMIRKDVKNMKYNLERELFYITK